MWSSPTKLAFATASLLSFAVLSSAQQIASGTYAGPLNTPKGQGCYSNAQPLETHGTYRFQSSGNCQNVCVGLHKPVMAITNGNDCWCGDKLPALKFKVDSSKCDTPCAGYNKDTCGGYELWQVWTTGTSLNAIPHLPAEQVSTSKKPAQTPSPEHQSSTKKVIPVATSADQTIYKTVHAPAATGASDSSSSSSSGTNTTAVVAGVVIGIVVLTAVVAGVYFWLRRKRLVELEAEKQAATIAGFIEGGRKAPTTASSMNDFRLDPETMQRRQSSGSIADNQDYSRRILQVTNPDNR